MPVFPRGAPLPAMPAPAMPAPAMPAPAMPAPIGVAPASAWQPGAGLDLAMPTPNALARFLPAAPATRAGRARLPFRAP